MSAFAERVANKLPILNDAEKASVMGQIDSLNERVQDGIEEYEEWATDFKLKYQRLSGEDRGVLVLSVTALLLGWEEYKDDPTIEDDRSVAVRRRLTELKEWMEANRR